MEQLIYIWWAALALVVIGLMALGWLVIGLFQHWDTVHALIGVIIALVIWRPLVAIVST